MVVSNGDLSTRNADFRNDLFGVEGTQTRYRSEQNKDLNLFVSALNLVAQHDSFGDFAHGLSSLAALALQSQVGFLFASLQIALQDSLSPFDGLSGIQLFAELRVGVF